VLKKLLLLSLSLGFISSVIIVATASATVPFAGALSGSLPTSYQYATLTNTEAQTITDTDDVTSATLPAWIEVHYAPASAVHIDKVYFKWSGVGQEVRLKDSLGNTTVLGTALFNAGNNYTTTGSWGNIVDIYINNNTPNTTNVTYGFDVNTFVDTTPPGEVSGLSELHTGTTGTLSWVNPADLDLNRVKVYRYNDTTTLWDLVAP
jgi:hypothetical protein